MYLIINSAAPMFYVSEYIRHWWIKRRRGGRISDLKRPHGEKERDVECIMWLNWSLLYIVIGFTAWVLDQVFHVCIPVSGGFQVHAIWHAFIALATLCGYFYMSNADYLK